MKKGVKIAIALIVIVALVVVLVMFFPSKTHDDEIANSNNTTSQETNNNTDNSNSSSATGEADDLTAMVDKIYSKMPSDSMPALETASIDVSNKDMVSSLTGLDDGKDLESLVVSQPLMNAQAYSLVLAKVKNGVDADKVAEKMCENIDMRRWICVEAEKVIATTSGDVVFMVMTDAENTDKLYECFKDVASKTGKEYTREAEGIEFPEDAIVLDM